MDEIDRKGGRRQTTDTHGRGAACARHEAQLAVDDEWEVESLGSDVRDCPARSAVPAGKWDSVQVTESNPLVHALIPGAEVIKKWGQGLLLVGGAFKDVGEPAAGEACRDLWHLLLRSADSGDPGTWQPVVSNTCQLLSTRENNIKRCHTHKLRENRVGTGRSLL